MEDISKRPGIYLVALRNSHPISVNADRPGIADRCIKVTSKNCKYGKAVNLARRRRDYFKTFGEENVDFRVLTVTHDCDAIEAALNVRLARFRIRGSTGRLNEWLEGITAVEVERQIREEIAEYDLDIEALAAPQQTKGAQVHHTARTNEPVSGVTPEMIVKAAVYLEENHMDKGFLRELHHWNDRETFASTKRYFSKVNNINSRNEMYGQRLLYVKEQHLAGRRDFSTLVEEALDRFPF